LGSPELEDLGQDVFLLFEHFLFGCALNRSGGGSGMAIPMLSTRMISPMFLL